MTTTGSVASARVSKNVDGSDAVRLPLNGQVLLKATLTSQFPEATGLRYLDKDYPVQNKDTCCPIPSNQRPPPVPYSGCV